MHQKVQYQKQMISSRCIRQQCDVQCNRDIMRTVLMMCYHHRCRCKCAIIKMADQKLFHCAICQSALKMPVTIHCGHTFCFGCLINRDKCPLCGIVNVNNKNVNVLAQDILRRWQYKFGNNRAISHHKSRKLTKFTKYQIESTLNKSIIIGSKKHLRKCRKISNWWKQLVNATDFECPICRRCIYNAVTTACGHTFCQSCLTRVLDHALSCPLCNAQLDLGHYHRGTTKLLDVVIKIFLPNSYGERLILEREANKIDQNEVPVFVCTNAFPTVACPLYVYEPRYRLLIRRCLMSSHKQFALVAKINNVNDKFANYGTLLEITDAVCMQNGSFLLTTVGKKRFRVVSKSEKDGYDTAAMQYLEDAKMSSDDYPHLLKLHARVYRKAFKWVKSLTPKVLAEVERLIGKMPAIEGDWLHRPDGPSWMWWLLPILPLSSHVQICFLQSIALETRLLAIDRMLDYMKIRMRAFEKNMICSSTENPAESCTADTNQVFIDYPLNNN